MTTADGARFAFHAWDGHRSDCRACRAGRPCAVGAHLFEAAASKGAAHYRKTRAAADGASGDGPDR